VPAANLAWGAGRRRTALHAGRAVAGARFVDRRAAARSEGGNACSEGCSRHHARVDIARREPIRGRGRRSAAKRARVLRGFAVARAGSARDQREHGPSVSRFQSPAPASIVVESPPSASPASKRWKGARDARPGRGSSTSVTTRGAEVLRHSHERGHALPGERQRHARIRNGHARALTEARVRRGLPRNERARGRARHVKGQVGR
jgi:hypothetical protein